MLREFRDQADSMFYHVRVKTTGWVGFGFAETVPNNMMNYDVIVGGFSNGKGYLHVSFFYRICFFWKKGEHFRDRSIESLHRRGVHWVKFL